MSGWTRSGSRRGCLVGPELVFGEVERASDARAVSGVGGGRPGEPAPDGLGVHADDLRELLGGQSGVPQGVLELLVRHVPCAGVPVVKAMLCRGFAVYRRRCPKMSKDVLQDVPSCGCAVPGGWCMVAAWRSQPPISGPRRPPYQRAVG